MGIGVDSIDIEAATQANIVVTKGRAYGIDETSHHALAFFGISTQDSSL
jgi:lactate dehydrogenase-like 2-hydroxyacid dehydrogenase